MSKKKELAGKSALDSAGARCRRMLVVEDEDAMARVLVNKFEHNGFLAERCCNGKDAIDRLKRETFDIILLDLLMPGVDGFTVLSKMAETLNIRTPVIVLTNLGQEDIMVKAKKLGARDCFMKSSISLNELVGKVEAIIGKEV
ncbi:response regulator [Candidatus Peregrinibacteria bacterium]|nr:response regulator [Candidatus Peregrinibacteria bacterium]